MTEHVELLIKFNACNEAIEFAEKFDTFEQAWNACERGDWMLWIAQKLYVNIRILTLAKALCAETVVHLMKDERSKNAVKIAKRFARYKTTEAELNAAADAAADADAADAAAAAAAFAAFAAAAAAFAADAAAFAADDAAKSKNLKQTADICRKVLTDEVFKKIKKL